jgi:WD40 repeat protein
MKTLRGRKRSGTRARPGRRPGPAPGHYDAFICYSRTGDAPVARALQRGLHDFAKPWYRLRALKVFLDDSSLAANPGLWGSIETALSSSRFLILLASERSAASPWVRREVEYWCTHRDVDQVLLVLTDPVDPRGARPRVSWDGVGADFDWENTPALPGVLAGLFRDEPRFVDLGWARSRDDLSLRDPALREAVADVAAPLWGRPKDELVGEDIRQHRRTLNWVRGAVAALTALAVVASVAAVAAVLQRNTAQARTAVAEARQYAAEAGAAADPYAALSLAVAAEQRTPSPLPEARAAFAAASRRATTWSARLVASGTLPWEAELTWAGEGRRLLAAHTGGSLHGWDLGGRGWSELSPAAPERPDQPPVIALAWGADGRTLAAGRLDGSFIVRDVRSPGLVVGPFGPDRRSRGAVAIALSRDGRAAATLTGDGTLRRWDARSGRPLGAALRIPVALSQLAWSPDGRRLAVAGGVGLVIWDLPSGRSMHRLTTGSLWSLAWSPDGGQLATGGADGTVRRWDGSTGEPVGRPLPERPGTAESMTHVAWSPDGSWLAAAGSSGTVRVWPARPGAGSAMALTSGEESYAAGLAWSADSRFLAAELPSAGRLTVGSSPVVRVWELAPARPAGAVFRASAGPVQATAWSPDGRYLATGGEDGAVWVWDVRAHRRVGGVANPESARFGVMVTAVAWSPDGRRLASASTDGIRVWPFSPGTTAVPAPWWASGSTLAIVWSPDGARLAGGDRRGVVRIWDVAAKKPLTPALDPGTGPASTDAVRWLAWAPGGRHLATGSREGRIRTWDVATGRTLGAPRTSPGVPRSMAWSAGGLLAVGDRDGVVRLWRPGTATATATLGGAGVVAALAWSPDGSRLASGGSGGSAQLRDGLSGSVLGETAAAQAGGVVSLSWSPDGTRLASGGIDGTVRIWRSTTEREACREASRELTLTPLTRSIAPVGLEVCTHPQSVRDFPPLPVLPATR